MTSSSGLQSGFAATRDGVRAVGGADAGGDAVARLDAHGERGAERGAERPGCCHHRQAEPADLLLGERQADEAAAVRGHEVDGLGRHELRRHHEVALVLAVLVVDEDDHLAGADVGDGAVHALEELRLDVQRRGHHILPRRAEPIEEARIRRRFLAAALRRRATYRASTSTSRFTFAPTSSASSVVFSRV